MSSLEIPSPNNQDPTEDGWIALAPVHFFPWILLGMSFLQDLLWAVLPFQWQATWMSIGWGFTLLHWGLGGMAVSVAYQTRPQAAQGSPRHVAFLLASVLLGAKICLRVAWQFAPRGVMDAQSVWMISQGAFLLMGLSALILLLFVQRGEEPGGRFDAAVTALVLAGGLEWIGLPVLAIAALRRHPLLAAQWQALRAPKAAMEGGWFDAQDEDLRLRNLGACSLLLAVAALFRVAHLVQLFISGIARTGGITLAWALADLFAAYLGSLILAFHVNRWARGQKGRGAAIAALLIGGLPVLLLLVVAVFLVLILTDVIHIRLF